MKGWLFNFICDYFDDKDQNQEWGDYLDLNKIRVNLNIFNYF